MLEKYPGESAMFDIDCSNLLASGETITGTPTMAYTPNGMAGGDALTFGTPTVNATPVTYPDGRVAAVGKAIQVRISGGTARGTKDGRKYAVRATFDTSAGQTLVASAMLNVLLYGA